MTSLESMAFFVRSCPLIIETSDKTKPPVFSLGRNYVYVADFNNGEPEENIVRKALWYVSRQGYSNIGVNNTALTEQEKLKLGTIVLSKERPYPFKEYSYKRGFMIPLRVAPDNPVYLHPFENLHVSRGRFFIRGEIIGQQYDQHLRKIFKEWVTKKTFPQEVSNLFLDPLQDQARLYRMIGNRAYKVSQNKNISSDIKQIADKIQELRREQRQKGVSVERLEDAVRLMSQDLNLTGHYSEPVSTFVFGPNPNWNDRWEWHTEMRKSYIPPPNEVEIEKARRAIAQAAYDIRQGYKQKGWEVRHGLVHAQAYRKLERIASQNADPTIIKQIIKRHFEGTGIGINKQGKDKNRNDPNYDFPDYNPPQYGYGDFRHAMLFSGALEYSIPDTEEDFKKIGILRVSQWKENVMPYSQEFNLIINLLRRYLLRKRFRDEVNNWLNRHGKEKVDWLEIRTRLTPSPKP
jgi:hypothetical protein